MPETPKKDDAKPLADLLVPDPKNPPELSMLQGWLGASAEDKHRRLYLDPELSQSLEIPEDAIVHTQDMPVEVNPLGGSWVWVKADAAIKQGPGLERLYARFLRGQIQQDFSGGLGAGVGGGTVGAPGTTPPFCATPTIFNCPTRQTWCRPSAFTICPSQLTLCQTRQVICQVTAPPFPSVAALCMTRVCPSAVDACPSAPGGCFDFTTVVQTTTVVQPGFGQFGFEQGLGFDPGAGAGGFVGAPVTQTPACQFGPIPVSQVALCQTSVALCQTAVVLCQTRFPQTCITRPTVCCPTFLRPWCPPTAFPATCPPRTHWGAGCPLPTRPPGCPTGFVCLDPGGGTTVINPAVAGGGFDPAGGFGFDPNAGFDPTGGMVGAAGGFGTAYPQCYTRYPACHPTMPSYYAPLCPR